MFTRTPVSELPVTRAGAAVAPLRYVPALLRGARPDFPAHRRIASTGAALLSLILIASIVGGMWGAP